MISSVVFIVFPFCLSIAALNDLFSATIPNRVSLVMISSFLFIAPLIGLNFFSISCHILVALTVFVICFVFFIVNIMGGGDAKFLTSASLWFGWDNSLFEFMLFVSFVGGVLAFFIMLMRLASRIFHISIPQSFLIKDKIPYGIAIAIGGFMTYPDSYLFKIALDQISDFMV
ncbi:Flp pilus assembly protein, protease CpaA [Candidatus Liberibacter americanus str. Sao Paulo]|uniref:Flp pilus assembly protein, protease CpaA n=2 Tax=Candidatus Liberibacter americanus TaxID=309868 RepID=U6B765_9HYPH|nr:Flp pilus assembly protein, protease CpaA [Candidatus Liberibacter americanus str. Sao Paulo]